MNREIGKYVLDHSTPEDPVLTELYRQTHLRFVNPNMVSGHIQGRLLEMIARMVRPSAILEIGTFTGYSAICLANGLAPDGILITVESNDELKEFAHSFFRKAGLESKIFQVTGRFQDVIKSIDRKFDLVFIDGDKREYTEYYNLVVDKVNRGGIIIADNVLFGGKVTDRNTNDPQTLGIIEFNEMIRRQNNIENLILSIRDGLMIIRKK